MQRRDCSHHQGAGHDAHHRKVREWLPKWSFFSVLPTGPGQRIPPLVQVVSCLGGGVSATNSFQIPSPSLSLQRRPEMRSQDPCAIPSPHLSLRPHGPCILPSPPGRVAAPRATRSLSSTQGGSLGDSAGNSPESSTSDPMAKPYPLLLESGSQPSAGREGKRQMVQTQTPHFQSRQALWTSEQTYNEQFLNRGLLAADNYPAAYLHPSFAEGAIHFNGIPPMLRADTVQS